MTALRAQGARRPAGSQRGRTANNYSIAQEFTNDTDKAGGKIDFQASPTVSMFGRYGWRDLSTDDQPTIPLPSGGGGNGNIYTRNKQLVVGTTYVPTDQSLLEVRFGWSNTQGGKNPPALGDSDTFGISGLPADPRIAGGLPSQTINGYSALGRQATNPQWQFPTVWNPKVNYSWLMGRQSFKAGYEFQKIDVEVQDVNPLYGLDTYAGQFSRPAGAAANNIYNLADFMLGLRSQYALSTFYIAEMQQQLHFTYLQDDIRVNDKLTLNLGLRYEYASPMTEANNALTNFDPVNRVDGDGEGRIDCRSRAGRSRPQQLRPPPRFRLHAGEQDGRARRLGHQLRAHQPDWIGQPARHQRPAGRPGRGRAGRCHGRDVPADRTGVSGGADRLVEVQSADRAHQLHPDGTTSRARCRAGTRRSSASSDAGC